MFRLLFFYVTFVRWLWNRAGDKNGKWLIRGTMIFVALACVGGVVFQVVTGSSTSQRQNAVVATPFVVLAQTPDYPATIAILQTSVTSAPAQSLATPISTAEPLRVATVEFGVTPTFVPTRVPPTASPTNPSWVADFHKMDAREISICANAANVRGGPDISYPILQTMTAGAHTTAYGWVRQWFYLGRGGNQLDYFVANSDVCALNQTQSSQSSQAQGSQCQQITQNTTYEEWLAMKQCAGIPELYPNTAESKANWEWDSYNEKLGAGTLKPGDLTASSKPCDTYQYNLWSQGKTDTFTPFCTPTPQVPGAKQDPADKHPAPQFGVP